MSMVGNIFLLKKPQNNNYLVFPSRSSKLQPYYILQ